MRSMPKHTKSSSRSKTLLRVKNWSEHEKALVQRGSLIFWFSDDFERVWLYAGEKQRGSQFEYSEKAIDRKHGRSQGSEDSVYHVRSLSEIIMFRLKTIFCDTLSARLLETQTTQALIRCLALNQITHLGMPDSYPVA